MKSRYPTPAIGTHTYTIQVSEVIDIELSEGGVIAHGNEILVWFGVVHCSWWIGL